MAPFLLCLPAGRMRTKTRCFSQSVPDKKLVLKNLCSSGWLQTICIKKSIKSENAGNSGSVMITTRRINKNLSRYSNAALPACECNVRRCVALKAYISRPSKCFDVGIRLDLYSKCVFRW